MALREHAGELMNLPASGSVPGYERQFFAVDRSALSGSGAQAEAIENFLSEKQGGEAELRGRLFQLGEEQVREICDFFRPKLNGERRIHLLLKIAIEVLEELHRPVAAARFNTILLLSEREKVRGRVQEEAPI